LKRPKIVVFGATGNQGGAVVKALLAINRWSVVAITRDPTSVAASWLSELGANVVKADPADQLSLLIALKDTYGVFAVTQPWSSEKGEYDCRKEIIQGKNIIWASRITGVTHLVFSSMINYHEKLSGVSFLDTKFEMESILKKQDIRYTILRCGIYMEKIKVDHDSRTIKGNYHPEALIPYVSIADIGRTTASVFNEGDKFFFKTLNLVGDFESGNGIACFLSGNEKGLRFTYKARWKLLMRLRSPEIYRLRSYFEKFGPRSKPLSMHENEFGKIQTMGQYFNQLRQAKKDVNLSEF
jgi:uncharacterized protein YbjT (DUF2867 family)